MICDRYCVIQLSSSTHSNANNDDNDNVLSSNHIVTSICIYILPSAGYNGRHMTFCTPVDIVTIGISEISGCCVRYRWSDVIRSR